MEQPPIEFWTAVEQFNQRQFYACHDSLEALWMDALEPDKKFYQGILQIAVALHHLENQNWRGAMILLGEGIRRLHHYPLDYGGIQIEPFLEQVVGLLQSLQIQAAEPMMTTGNPSGNPADSLHILAPSGSLPLPVLQKVAETS